MCNTHVDQEKAGSVDQGFVFRGHSAPVVAVSCDEDKVVSASEDGSVTVWDASKGTPCYSIRKHVDGDLVSSVDFNERYLVVDGTNGAVFVWDYSVGSPARRAPPTRKSRRGASSSSKKRAGPAAGPGGSSTSRKGGAPPPPELPPGLPFNFIGGWNLGHGPVDLGAGSTGIPDLGMGADHEADDNNNNNNENPADEN